MSVLKPMTHSMRLAWYVASITSTACFMLLLRRDGISTSLTSIPQLSGAVLGFALLSFVLRLFFQQAQTPNELFRNFFVRRRR